MQMKRLSLTAVIITTLATAGFAKDYPEPSQSSIKMLLQNPNIALGFDSLYGDFDIGAELIKRGLALDIPSFTGGKYTEFETKEARRRIKNVPYKVKATKAKQPAPKDRGRRGSSYRCL